MHLHVSLWETAKIADSHLQHQKTRGRVVQSCNLTECGDEFSMSHQKSFEALSRTLQESITALWDNR